MAVEVLREGGRVAWFDADAMGAGDVVERLRLLGVADELISDGFGYSAAAEVVTRGDLEEVAAQAISDGRTLVVVDSWDPALEAAGFDPNANSDVNTFVRLFVNPLTLAGITVALVDHVTKNRESRGRYSVGAGAKLRAVDVHLGFRARVDQRLDRERDGALSVKVHKDRQGLLNRRSEYRMDLVHDDAGGISWDVVLKDGRGGAWEPTCLMERISRYLEVAGGQSGRTIRESVTGKATHLGTALEALVKSGCVVAVPGDRAGWVRYESARPFREAAAAAPEDSTP